MRVNILLACTECKQQIPAEHKQNHRQHGGNHNLHQNTAAENFFGGVLITLAHAY